MAEPAVNYWRNAAALAASRSAVFESVAHLEHGLDALGKQPADRSRDQTELELRLPLAGALRATKGWVALETQTEFQRARQLANQIGDQGSLIRATFGAFGGHFIQDSQLLAYETAQETLKLAETCNDDTGRWIGHCCVGMTSFQIAAFQAAIQHFEKALVFDDLEREHNTFLLGIDYSGMLLNFFSRTLAVVGHLNQARVRRDQLFVREKALGHSPGRANSMVGAFVTSCLIGDTAGQTAAAEILRGIVAEDRFPLFRAWASVYSGWVEIEAGNPEHGCQLISEGIDALDTLASRLGQYFYMLLLANGQLRLGKIDAGLGTIDRAESLIRKTGSTWCKAELHRLRGDLLLARSAQDDAETSYQKALKIARLQHAKLWEIRAATALGRLWRDQGKRQVASDLLTPVYDWFAEGLEMPDLKNAKTLLDELGSKTVRV